MIFMVFMEFIAFPERKDAFLHSSKENMNNIISEASGSLGICLDGKCRIALPNETYNVNEKMDWCSNLAKSKTDRP